MESLEDKIGQVGLEYQTRATVCGLIQEDLDQLEGIFLIKK